MTSTELTPMQTFEEKVKSRLIKDIGDLVPDEALIAMIHKAMDEAFFKERVRYEDDGYRKREIREKAVFLIAVQDLIKPRMDECLRKWLDDHEDEVLAKLNDFVKEQAGKVLVESLGTMFSQAMSTYQFNIEEVLRNLPRGTSR